MSRMTKRRKLLFGAATVAICGTIAIGMTSEAPLILYPITPSLPPGLYIRTFVPPKVGTIAAFHVPEAARQHKASIGEHVHDDFLFMKPIVAGPGDLTCNDVGKGLFVNGKLIHAALTWDVSSETLPVRDECRRLGRDEFFAMPEHPRSFDSRIFGPVKSNAIIGTYEFHLSLPYWRALI